MIAVFLKQDSPEQSNLIETFSPSVRASPVSSMKLKFPLPVEQNDEPEAKQPKMHPLPINIEKLGSQTLAPFSQVQKNFSARLDMSHIQSAEFLKTLKERNLSIDHGPKPRFMVSSQLGLDKKELIEEIEKSKREYEESEKVSQCRIHSFSKSQIVKPSPTNIKHPTRKRTTLPKEQLQKIKEKLKHQQASKI